jgi:acyl carrier protein
MDEQAILSEIESLLDAEPHSIQPQNELKNLRKWDSLAVISFMSVADEKFGALISPRDLEKAMYVADLVSLVKNSRAS